MSKCGKCGGEGHNARSCGKGGVRLKPSKFVSGPAPQRKERRAVLPPPNTSVTQALVARRDQLAAELAKLDGIIAAIGELGL